MGQPLLVMAELLWVYDKLLQATTELFGGHSQFALALKEGFASVFQGLDEVAGVRVREGERDGGREREIEREGEGEGGRE